MLSAGTGTGTKTEQVRRTEEDREVAQSALRVLFGESLLLMEKLPGGTHPCPYHAVCAAGVRASRVREPHGSKAHTADDAVRHQEDLGVESDDLVLE